jgi:hypothetical protein
MLNLIFIKFINNNHSDNIIKNYNDNFDIKNIFLK